MSADFPNASHIDWRSQPESDALRTISKHSVLIDFMTSSLDVFCKFCVVSAPKFFLSMNNRFFLANSQDFSV